MWHQMQINVEPECVYFNWYQTSSKKIINHINQQVALQVQHALDFYPIIYNLKDAACLKSASIMLGKCVALIELLLSSHRVWLWFRFDALDLLNNQKCLSKKLKLFIQLPLPDKTKLTSDLYRGGYANTMLNRIKWQKEATKQVINHMDGGDHSKKMMAAMSDMSHFLQVVSLYRTDWDPLQSQQTDIPVIKKWWMTSEECGRSLTLQQQLPWNVHTSGWTHSLTLAAHKQPVSPARFHFHEHNGVLKPQTADSPVKSLRCPTSPSLIMAQLSLRKGQQTTGRPAYKLLVHSYCLVKLFLFCFFFFF